MPLEMRVIPCLRDNYAYLLRDPESGRVAVVDVPEAEPVRRALDAEGWVLTDILITHHHDDHIAGVTDLRAQTGAQVWGAAQDAARLPLLDHALSPGDSVSLGTQAGEVIDVPGHTVGHIAFHFPDSQLAFTADSLMALGCGRLFEGTPEQMWASLQTLMRLPDETRICSGHDYSKSNGAFATHVDPDNSALQARLAQLDRDRGNGAPMAVATLAQEKATNPFLRAGQDYLKDHHGMKGATDLAMFTHLRSLKDTF